MTNLRAIEHSGRDGNSYLFKYFVQGKVSIKQHTLTFDKIRDF